MTLARGFEADKTRLWRAANELRAYVPAARPETIPFQGLWIGLGDQQVVLTVTNGDVTIAAEVPAATWGRASRGTGLADAVALPVHIVVPLLRRLPAGPIHIELGEQAARIEAGSFRCELDLITREVTRPEAPLEPGVLAEMPAPVLTAGLRHLALSLEHSDGWGPELQGIEIRPAAGYLKFTATDKRTLAQADLPCPNATVPPAMEDRPLLLPRTALHPLAQLIRSDGAVEVTLQDGRFELADGSTRIQAALKDGPFVHYAPVVIEQPGSIVCFRRKLLLEVLERAALMPPAHGAMVELKATDGGVTCRTDGGEVGDTVETLEAYLAGMPVTLTLPLGPLAAMVRLLPGDEVEVGSHDPTKPVSITTPGAPEFRYHMMPTITPLRPRHGRWRSR